MEPISGLHWVKSFHIIFVVAWFAGLFYLPRLFVYHVQATGEDPRSEARFQVMERKLFGIMTIGAIGALAFGLWLIHWWAGELSSRGWLHAKLVLVAALVGFHAWCWKLMRDLGCGSSRHGERFFRIINEIPALLLIAIVVLVVAKPF